MKSDLTKSLYRKAAFQRTGFQHYQMKHIFLWAGLLCILFSSNSIASFWDIQVSPWNGGKDHYCGDTLIKSGTFKNSGKMATNFSTLPANTGPLECWGGSRSGDYWYGVSVMAKGDTGITINNDSGATIQSTLTANSPVQIAGILALQKVTINNSGTCDGQLLNKDGFVAGIFIKGPVNITNNAGATCSATGNYASAIEADGGKITIINNGTIKAIATGGSQTKRSHAGGVDLFSYDGKHGAPIYFENNGSITAVACSTGCDTNRARAVNIWAEGSSATFKNTGTLLATTTGANGEDNGIYCGADNGDVTFYNSGTISNSGSGGFCVGLENDSDTGNMYIENSGTISTKNPFAIMLGNYKSDLKSCGHCYFKNTGTISGGWLGLSWPAIGGMTFFDSGDIRTTLCWLGGNVNATICGLPTIDPELGADTSGHNNTLVFNLDGTLEKINDKAASGTTLSGLSSQGSIVVSGKKYRWKGFNSVSGTVFPGNKCSATVSFKRNENRPLSFSIVNNIMSFSLPFKTASFLLRVYDIRGKLVSSIVKKELQAGRNSIPLKSLNLSSGSYLCDISIDKKRYGTEMVNVR
jgi:hypothetical protein